jgi:thiamine-phosphate pyrophosphorylase
MLVLAGDPIAAAPGHLRGRHSRGPHRAAPGLIRTAPVHDLPEIRAAEKAGADLLFLSPAFPTRSHPGAAALGPLRFLLLAGQARAPVIALGGMNAKRARKLGGTIYGWAAIDAWSAVAAERQKRKAVPT